MKIILITITFVLIISVLHTQAQENLLLDDFEESISTGPTGTIGAGTNGNTTIEVTGDKVIKYSGKQSLKVTFDTSSGAGAAWVAKGLDLEETPNSGWRVNPQDINWNKYFALSFYVYGSNSQNTVKLHIVDGGQEILEYVFKDDFTGWKDIICNFNDFYTSPSWQSKHAKKNGKIDFPIKSFSFLFPPKEKGTLYIDRAELVAK